MHSGAPLATFNRDKNLIKAPKVDVMGFGRVKGAAAPNRDEFLATRCLGLRWVASEVIRKRYSYALGMKWRRALSGSTYVAGSRANRVASQIAVAFSICQLLDQPVEKTPTVGGRLASVSVAG